MSKFNVGDEVSFNNENWIIEQPCLLGGWILRHSVNKYRSAVVSEDDLVMVRPAPEIQTCFVVCDECGVPVSCGMDKLKATQGWEEQLMYRSYSIHTFALTPINE